MLAQQRRGLELPPVVLYCQHSHISKKMVKNDLIVPGWSYAQKFSYPEHHVIGLPRTLVCFGSTLSGLGKSTESQWSKASSVSIYNPKVLIQIISVPDRVPRPWSGSASWDKGNGKQLYLSGFTCISKIPARKSLNTTKRAFSNSWSYKFKKPSINKQQQKFNLKEWTKRKKGRGVCADFFLLVAKNF